MLIWYGTRVRLASSSMNLETMGLLTALSVPRAAWNLPISSLALKILMVALAQGPGALWAGAITPITVQEARTIGSILVPQFKSETRNIWDSEFHLNEKGDVWNYIENCTERRDEATYISNCPVPNHQAALLDSARSASTVGTRNHSKPDSLGWTYQGRSYGVGSSQGLSVAQGLPPHYKLLGSTYNETGYLSKAACQRNSSANLTFEYDVQSHSVTIWYVTGYLPNSNVDEFYPIMAWSRGNRDAAAVCAWAAVSNNNTGSHMIGIVASALYGNFSNLQCDVVFAPQNFSVNVNHTSQVIAVSPDKSTVAVDIEPTGHLQSNAIRSINLLSRMTPSLYVSVLGEGLAYNLYSLMQQHNSTPSSSIDEEFIFTATEDSFMAMLDSVLGIYGGAQLVLANSSAHTPIAGTFEACWLSIWYYWSLC
ncbi:hypothetical protein BFW01_g10414 [Lasiodiplodia theobromae]|uniref:Uncharacterized protein n=1 Tax=Lasiodiplodia theobromae TaxID=45133 RepID=A0A8H7MAQ6_9PEZI|nr:hypothetical protein BFW01_g10414 [Lasiodiplodia theobromae]